MAGFRHAEHDWGLLRSRSVGFAVGRQPRTGFAFGVSMATTGGVSKWPEKPGLFGLLRGQTRFAERGVVIALSTRRRTGPRGCCEEPVKPMAHFVANRCHTPACNTWHVLVPQVRGGDLSINCFQVNDLRYR